VIATLDKESPISGNAAEMGLLLFKLTQNYNKNYNQSKCNNGCKE